MDPTKKLVEALDGVIDGMDAAIAESTDTSLTESQIDDEIMESIDTYIKDVELVIENWSPEMKAYFNERIDKMLEDSEPELFEERNIVRLDRNAVFNQLVGLFSLVIARRRHDPAFALYRKGSAIRRKAKNTIKSKYQSRAIVFARKILRKRRFKV